MTSKTISYAGKTVFVGIDVHRKTFAVTVNCDGQIVTRATLVARPAVLLDFVQKRFQGADIHSVYEAGFSGFVLHRALVAGGIKNIVVNAASIEVKANDRVKTDKRDSIKLASQLSKGNLKGIRIPSEEEELRRTLHRTREQLVTARSTAMVQIRMKLLQFGWLPMDYDKVLSLKDVRGWIGRLPEELRLAIQGLVSSWEALSVEIKKLNAALRHQAKEDPSESIYRSAPGIGPIGARVLSTELGDMTQFANERRLFCFSGLTPSEKSSGENVRRGHITRQGSGRIRKILTEAAWRAIKRDYDLAATYTRISRMAGGKKAIVAIARKLLGRIRRMFRTGELYRITPWPVAAA